MPLVAFGILLLVLTAVQLPFGPSAPEVALLGGAGAACLTCGLIALAAGRRRARPAAATAPPPTGGPFVVAAGLAALLVGAEAGLWLILIGAGLVVLGAALLARRRRAA